jgi:branched-chain amino acid aminotransferase
VIRPLLLHNEEIRPADERSIAPGQIGFLNGWGVFSTLKVREGVLFAYPRHFARMKRDAERMRVPFPFAPDELEERLLQLVEANGELNATLRVAVVRNQGTMFEGPGLQRAFELLAFTAPLREWGSSASLGLVPQARHAANVYRGTKFTSWSMNLCWYEEAHERGYDEVVLLNERGEVAECTSANLFAVFGREAVTPPLDSGCLPGVTRAVLLEEVRAPGLTVTEGVLFPEDLELADEVFITSSTRDLMPVRAVEGLRLKPSDYPAQRAFQAAFTDKVDGYVAGAPRRARLPQTAGKG